MFPPARRLAIELKNLTDSPVPGCSAAPVDADDLRFWAATITGPPDTPYAGGTWQLSVEFTDDYPSKPPVLKFETPIFHCNVSEGGHICLDILKEEWSPRLQVGAVLLSLQSMLAEPNPDDPLRGDIARLWKRDRAKHDAEALRHAVEHAGAPPPASLPPPVVAETIDLTLEDDE